jgi:putative intracellular protease/amidase
MHDGAGTDLPDRDALLALLARVEELYRQGGPETPGGHGPYEPDAWVGEVLAELVDPANDDTAVFAGVAASCGLINASGLLALIRLTAAKAVEAALRHAVGEPGPSGSVTAEMVLDEVATTQSWLQTGTP